MNQIIVKTHHLKKGKELNKEKLTREIVINKCWGGFGLSHDAIMLYAEYAGFKLYPFVEIREKKGVEWSSCTGKFKSYIDERSKSNPYDLIFYSKKPLKRDGTYEEYSWFSVDNIKRDDSALTKVVKKLKEKSFDTHAELKIVKIPDDIKWEINDYDGMESIEEKHKSWGLTL